MKILISLVLFFGFLGSAVAGPLAVMEILPGSNNPNSTISISSAVTPAIVAISSTSPTRIDTALNASLLSALGATYKRFSVIYQTIEDVAIYCGYSASEVSVTTGFKITKGDIYTEKLGRAIPPYCIGASTGSLLVGGWGYK